MDDFEEWLDKYNPKIELSGLVRLRMRSAWQASREHTIKELTDCPCNRCYEENRGCKFDFDELMRKKTVKRVIAFMEHAFEYDTLDVFNEWGGQWKIIPEIKEEFLTPDKS